LGVPNLSTGYSLEAWIYPTSWSGTIMGRNYETGLWFGLTTTGKLRFYPKGGVSAYFQGQTTIPLNRWTHVAAVYRSGMARLLVNGAVDARSSAFTGTSPNNLQAIYVGADNNATGDPDDRFVGMMDEVRLVLGPRSPAAIRSDMWYLRCTSLMVDEDGVSRPVSLLHAGECLSDYPLAGSASRYVASGAPMFDIGGPFQGDLDGIFVRHTGVEVSGTDLPSFEEPLDISLDVPVTDLEVFVNLEFSRDDADQPGTTVQLIPPGGSPVVTLFSNSPPQCREMRTFFDDENANIPATTLPPFTTGLHPVQPLSVLDGVMSAGTWRLRVNPGPGQTRCRLNTWGLRINHINTVSVSPTQPAGASLRLVGVQPIRNDAELEYALSAPGVVDLGLFDAAGRRVARLSSGWRPAGIYRAKWLAGDQPAGVYFGRLSVDGHTSALVRLVLLSG
jgi:hypothetical protein